MGMFSVYCGPLFIKIDYTVFRDDKLSMEEFAVLCSDLLCNAKNEPYSLTPEKLEEVFAVFDVKIGFKTNK